MPINPASPSTRLENNEPSKLEYKVTLIKDNGNCAIFFCGTDEPLFQAAQRSGYRLTLGCMQGRCAICKAKLISGQVYSLRQQTNLAQPADILLCSYAPLSDATLWTYSPWSRHKSRPT